MLVHPRNVSDHDELTRQLVLRWREDPGGTYRTWFLWEERLKNFRSLRRGIARVAAEIEAGSFGNVYRGSSLETVTGANPRAKTNRLPIYITKRTKKAA